MSAPLCTVTPLEALRRLYDVARKVDAKESGEFETLLQGELLVAEAAMRAAAPVVPVAAQPVVPMAWRYEWASCITTDGPQDFRLKFEAEPPPDWAVTDGQARNVVALYAAPQPAASVTDVAKDAQDAKRWRFSQEFQNNPDQPQPEPIIAMWRKVYEEGRRCPTAKEYEDVIDAAIAAQQGEKTK